MKHNWRPKLALLAILLLVAVASTATWRVVAAPLNDVGAFQSGGAARAAPLEGSVAAPPVPGGPGFYSMSAFEFSLGLVRLTGPELWCGDFAEGCTVHAPVILPNGAAVTKFVLYFWDSSTNDLSASLYRVPLDGNPVEKMAETFSAGSPGYGSSATTLINCPVIDQRAYTYYVEVFLPYAHGSDTRLRGVRIDYGYGTNLPLVTKQH